MHLFVKIHLLLRESDSGIICLKNCAQIKILIHLKVGSKICALKATLQRKALDFASSLFISFHMSA